MSASGYTPILIYASGTTTNVPSASNLTSGSTGAELAINYYDGKLFYKDNSGAVQVLATKSSASGSFTNVTVGGTLAVTGAVALNGGGTSTTPTSGDNTTKIATTSFVTTALQAIYPVGSIYMNTSSSTNPGTLFGFGTWVALAAGQMLLGNGGGYTAGTTGGSSTTTIGLTNLPAHTHSITDPGHNHTYGLSGNSNQSLSGGPSQANLGVSTTNTGTASTGITATNNTQSGGTAFANTAMTTISPYLVVYMWQRTA